MKARYVMLWCAVFLAMGMVGQEKVSLSFSLLLFLGAVCSAVLAVILFSRRNKKWYLWIGIALFIFLQGMTRMEIAYQLWEEYSSYMVGTKGIFTGICASSSELHDGAEGYTRTLVDLQQADLNGVKKSLSGKAYVYTAPDAAFVTGDLIQVKGQLTPVRVFKNPGKISLAGRYRSMGLIGKIYSPAKDVKYIRHTERYLVQRWTEKMRENLMNRFSPYLDSLTLPLLMTLLFGGNYDAISPSVMQSFSATGIVHILSVSGSHISLLFGFLYLLGSWIRLPRKITLFVSILLVLFYALMAGLVPPVVRAAVMGILSAGGVLFKRDETALNALGTAVFFMLLWNPFYIDDVSFQLSAGASAGILVFYRPLTRFLLRFPILPRWIREGTALSCAAQVLTTPIVLYDFHVFPLYFIPANLFVTPLLEWSIIGGLLAAVSSFLFTPLCAGLLYTVHFMICFSVTLNRFLSSLPGASLHLGGMNFWEILFYFSTVGCLYFYTEIKKMGKKGFLFLIVELLSLAGAGSSVIAAPSEYCFVPDVGMDQCAVVSLKEHPVVYYHPSAVSSPLSTVEIESFLQYEGIFDTDLLILNLESVRKPVSFSFSNHIREIWVIAGQETRIKNKAACGESLKIIKPGKFPFKNDIIVETNGSSWLIGLRGQYLYFNGIKPMPLVNDGAHLAWIGGAQSFGPALSSRELKLLNPELSVYVGNRLPQSGEDKELFSLEDIPLKDPSVDGAVAIYYSEDGWSF